MRLCVVIGVVILATLCDSGNAQAVITQDIRTLQKIAVKNPTLKLMYRQLKDDNLAVFADLARRFSPNVPFNLTAITQYMSDPEVMFTVFMIAAAAEPACGAYLMWDTDTGWCSSSVPWEKDNSKPCTIMLILMCVALLLVFIVLAVRFYRKRKLSQPITKRMKKLMAMAHMQNLQKLLAR